MYTQHFVDLYIAIFYLNCNYSLVSRIYIATTILCCLFVAGDGFCTTLSIYNVACARRSNTAVTTSSDQCDERAIHSFHWKCRDIVQYLIRCRCLHLYNIVFNGNNSVERWNTMRQCVWHKASDDRRLKDCDKSVYGTCIYDKWNIYKERYIGFMRCGWLWWWDGEDEADAFKHKEIMQTLFLQWCIKQGQFQRINKSEEILCMLIWKRKWWQMYILNIVVV